MAAFINALAWILCIVFGGLLLGDLIRTEKYFSERRSEEGESSDGKKEALKNVGEE